MKESQEQRFRARRERWVSSASRHFFQSINTRDADGLQASCEDILSSLLGKNSATKADVVTFMNKLYKDVNGNLNWFLTNDYKIKKREVGDEDYEYQVQFSAREEVQLTDGTKKNQPFQNQRNRFRQTARFLRSTCRRLTPQNRIKNALARSGTSFLNVPFFCRVFSFYLHVSGRFSMSENPFPSFRNYFASFI